MPAAMAFAATQALAPRPKRRCAHELPAPNSRRGGLRSRLFTARLISPTARVAVRPIANKGKRRQRRLRFCFWREHQPQLTQHREKYRSVQWNCDRPSIVGFDALLLTAFLPPASNTVAGVND